MLVDVQASVNSLSIVSWQSVHCVSSASGAFNKYWPRWGCDISVQYCSSDRNVCTIQIGRYKVPYSGFNLETKDLYKNLCFTVSFL